jgi:hypothetical protein
MTNKPSRPKPILCLDFDGVIHGYDSGWKGAHIIPDKPVQGSGKFILDAMKHFTVAIHSSRSKSLRGRAAMKGYVFRLLWDAYYEANATFWDAYHAQTGVEPEWTPWTHCDDRGAAQDLFKEIQWPWFKPAAFVTLEDRAVTFTGEWPSIEQLMGFKPWNKKQSA